MKKISKLVALVLLLAILTACGGGAGSTGTGAKGIFIDGSYGGDAETLNSLLVADATSSTYIGYTLDSLATYNNKLEIHLLCLAKDIEVSGDGLTYTVTIRDDLKWSNGSQVTAEDYVYTLKNLMFSDWLNYPYKEYWQEDVAGKLVLVKPGVVNTTTFTITRQTIDPEFVYKIYGLVPYPQYITSKYEGNIEAFTRAPEFNTLSYTGNLGAYRFKEWIRNDRYVVERNPDYYLGKDKGAPFFQQVIVKQFGNATTMMAALEAGDITSGGITAEKVSRFKSLDKLNVYTLPTSSYSFIAYNQRKNGWEGLRNTAVRQAFSMCINKESIGQQVMYGFAEPAYSFIPKVSPWYNDASVVKYGVGALYDKKKAKQLLFEAGYGRKKADGSIEIVDKGGAPIKLRLVTTIGEGTGDKVTSFIIQELSEIGIQVEKKPVPWEMMLRKYLMNKVPGSNQEPRDNNGPDAVSEEQWDFAFLAFTNDIMAPSGSRVFFNSDGGLNFFGYSNPKVDDLFKRKLQTREALDKEYRKKLYTELSQILSEDQPVDFLVFSQSNSGYQKNVKGIEPGISMGYNFYLWYFE